MFFVMSCLMDCANESLECLSPLIFWVYVGTMMKSISGKANKHHKQPEFPPTPTELAICYCSSILVLASRQFWTWTTTRLGAFLQPSTENQSHLLIWAISQWAAQQSTAELPAKGACAWENKATMEEAQGWSGAREESLGENLAIRVNHFEVWISSYATRWVTFLQSSMTGWLA